MKGTFQEEEMHLASKFCKELSKSFLDVLTIQSKSFSNVDKKTKQKITNEKNDIEKLKNTFNRAKQILVDNQRRLSEIPKEINDLKEDNNNCEASIASTPIPVYDYYYDEDYGLIERIDHYQTEANREYVYRLQRKIEDNNEKIEKLESEKKRCEHNIECLTQMLEDIMQVIESKNQLITHLQDELTKLTDSFSKYKNGVNSSINDVNEIDKKIIKAATLVNGYGTSFGSASYDGLTIGYSSKDIFNVTGDILNEEIQGLINMVKTSNTLRLGLSKSLGVMDSLISGNYIDDVKIAVNRSSNNLKNIDQYHIENIKKLKRALSYLLTYESIHF